MHTFVFIISCIGDPACITYSFMMIILVALIELVVVGFVRFIFWLWCVVFFVHAGCLGGVPISAGCWVRCGGVF